ncbi:MAG: 1-acyl-sn-glycerol-3-phosphate acyltransferase [Planctomycetota bacterium]
MTRDLAVRFVRWLLGCFFRRVEVAGLEHLPPPERGGVLVSWHPNGLIDPALILTHVPRRVVFGARHGLFRWPVLGLLMRALGTVPIYRAQDQEGEPSEARRGIVPPGARSARSERSARESEGDEARRARNRESLDALARVVADGSYSTLFPEGVSHDAPHLQALKVGAARLYYRACQLRPPGAPLPAIVPVGLHYGEKQTFRSDALVELHPPLELPERLAELPPETSEEDYRARCAELTAELERALVASVRPTESWELHHLMQRARALLRAERARRAGAELAAPGPGERALGFARVWEGYQRRREDAPEATAALLRRVREYHEDLIGLGLEDDELDRSPRQARPLYSLLLALQVLGVYLLLPPLLVLGAAVNGLPYLAIRWISWLSARQQKDLATIKWLLGVLLFPAAWAGAGALVWLGWLDLARAFPGRIPHTPTAAALSTLLLAAAGGLFALRYGELTSRTLRALRVRLTRARYRAAVARLLTERAALHDALTGMATGLALPGEVTNSGRVLPG